MEVRVEVPLGTEPQRTDFLLLRRREMPAEGEGTHLRGLWHQLARDTVVEFKSVRRPFRETDLLRLLGYGCQWYVTADRERLATQEHLTLALVVPLRTDALDAAVAAMNWRWEVAAPGYWWLRGGPFATVVVALDAVAGDEGDDLVEYMATGKARTWTARHWLALQVGTTEAGMKVDELEDSDDGWRELAAVLPARFRLEGLAPAQRLEGLGAADLLLALPDDVLRGLSVEYLASLPEDLRTAIRARIRGGQDGTP